MIKRFKFVKSTQNTGPQIIVHRPPQTQKRPRLDITDKKNNIPDVKRSDRNILFPHISISTGFSKTSRSKPQSRLTLSRAHQKWAAVVNYYKVQILSYKLMSSRVKNNHLRPRDTRGNVFTHICSVNHFDNKCVLLWGTYLIITKEKVRSDKVRLVTSAWTVQRVQYKKTREVSGIMGERAPADLMVNGLNLQYIVLF